MMDCHILNAAHNAAITGPKCRVCATFTIEMRRRADVEILIISFPLPRAEGTASSEAGMRHAFPLFCRAINEEPFGLDTNLRTAFRKLRGRRRVSGGFFFFASVSVIVVHLSAVHHGQNRRAVPCGSHLIPHWRWDGERMATVRGSVAALRRVQSDLHQCCWLRGTRWHCLDSLTTSSSLPDGSYWCD